MRNISVQGLLVIRITCSIGYARNKSDLASNNIFTRFCKSVWMRMSSPNGVVWMRNIMKAQKRNVYNKHFESTEEKHYESTEEKRFESTEEKHYESTEEKHFESTEEKRFPNIMMSCGQPLLSRLTCYGLRPHITAMGLSN